MIAAFRSQTDRNIRKVYNAMMAELREDMYFRIYPRYKAELPLTFAQREFMRVYIEQHGEKTPEERREPKRKGRPKKKTCNDNGLDDDLDSDAKKSHVDDSDES